MQVLTGEMPDISPIQFFFWEPVYYHDPTAPFPSESTEKKGRFVGVAENVGDSLTFKILTDDTNQIIYRSTVRSALNQDERNLRLDELKFSDPSEPVADILSAVALDKGEQEPGRIPTISPDDIIGCTYLTDPTEDEQRFRARIVRQIQDHEDDVNEQPDKKRFLVSINDDQAEEVVSYNEILDHIEKEASNDDDGNQLWKFKSITGHAGPLVPDDSTYKGSSYNVLVEWEDGSCTYEPLHIFAADSPVIVAKYAAENGLLSTPGWKRFRRISKNEKKMKRLINQARLVSIRRAVVYQYGYQVPRTPHKAIELDKKNGNTRWQDAMTLELSQLADYDTFRDLGVGDKRPAGYKKFVCTLCLPSNMIAGIRHVLLLVVT